MDIFNTIWYLVPDAKFSVWECSLADFQGEGTPIQLGDKLIAWNSTNSRACPTLEELEAVDPALVEQFKANKINEDREASARQDLTLMAVYNLQKQSNPSLTLLEFLDSLQG